MRVFLMTAIFGLVFSTTSQAGEIVSAGTPAPTELSTETSDFADIFQRQLEYRVEANKLEALMKERQENFAAPRAEAYSNYLDNVSDLADDRGESDDDL